MWDEKHFRSGRDQRWQQRRSLRVYAGVRHDDNPASVRVIEKNGGKLWRTIENPIKTRIIVDNNDELQVVDVVQRDLRCHVYWIALA